jgi:DNA-binding NarL/FixJ family response regulator
MVPGTGTGAAPSGGTGRGPGAGEPGDTAAVDALRARLHERWGDVLTERELDVALLVVDGASNKEVAEWLFVSVRTVEVHLGRVFRKLGVRSRVELTVVAHRG